METFPHVSLWKKVQFTSLNYRFSKKKNITGCPIFLSTIKSFFLPPSTFKTVYFCTLGDFANVAPRQRG